VARPDIVEGFATLYLVSKYLSRNEQTGKGMLDQRMQVYANDSSGNLVVQEADSRGSLRARVGQSMPGWPPVGSIAANFLG
jgi:hypothetical protein